MFNAFSKVAFYGLAALVLSTCLLTACDSTPSNHAESGLPPGASVAFIGDSYTAGTQYGGKGDKNFTQIVGRRFSWNVRNYAIGGVGYVNRTPKYGGFEASQISNSITPCPNALIVVGSRNDLHSTPGLVYRAATHLYSTASAHCPDIRIVVVGPLWQNSAPPAPLLALRDALQDAATSSHATFIDPLSPAWLDTGLQEIGPDGVHPNDGGHQAIAQHLETDLEANGLAPSPSG